MINITIANGSKRYYGDDVLSNINISLNETDKIAIIGSNGCGKTTLLKLLNGTESLSTGTYSKRKEVNIAYLEQHIDLSDLELSAIDYLKLEFQELFDLEQKIRKLEKQIAADDDPKLLSKYGNALEMFNTLGGYEIESIIYKTADEFNLSIDFLNNPVKFFSYGEMKILRLIRLLLQKPEVLLLDEPTNHLDYEKVAVLEKFLTNYQGTIVFISHDRYFIDKISNYIYHIEAGAITEYHGNYSFFIAQYKLLFDKLSTEYKEQMREIKRIKEQIQRYKTWGVKNEVFLVMASRLQKKLDELPELKKPREVKARTFEEGDKSLKKFAIQFKNYSLAVDDNPIIDNLEFDVLRNDIVQIVGPNGAGKTTFLKDIYTKCGLENESIRFHINTKICYLPQQINYQDDEITILEYCLDQIESNPAKARSLLAKYDFKADVVTNRLKSLSGGERVRLEFAKIFSSDCNLLLLDEPTNHIDIVTKEMLENYIHAFSGTVIFISHDRYFINKVMTKTLDISN